MGFIHFCCLDDVLNLIDSQRSSLSLFFIFIPFSTMKKIGIALVASTCLVVSLYSCTQSKAEKEEEHVVYPTTHPVRVDTTFNKEYVSQIRSVRNIEIRALEKGFLEQMYVDEGQNVHAGQLLFRIMPKLYQAEYLKAQAEVKAGEIEVQNVKILAEKQIVSPNELALAQAKLEKAKAEVALAKFHLSATEIRAPFDGVIDRIPLKLGSLVDEGELLTSLSDNSQMFAYFNVSEPEYLDYQNNATAQQNKDVKLLLANNQLLKYPGRVETVEGEFNSETGNIAFRARFPNPDRLLKNGQTGKIQMRVPLEKALVIPQKATYEVQDQKYAFVVDAHGVVHSRLIEISHMLPDVYVVSAGLSENDQVLLEGLQKVKDDEHVRTKLMDPKFILGNLRLKSE